MRLIWPVYLKPASLIQGLSHRKMSEPPRRHKSNSDFSIERILATDPPKKKSSEDLEQRPDVTERLQPEVLAGSGNDGEFATRLVWMDPQLIANSEWCKQKNVACPRDELPWLRCTRYKPPKLPRKSSNGKCVKRRLGSQPRIPFTKFQLEVLEEKYKNGAYLTRKDVIHLSGILHLPQSRVKIWFQNRRARERKESKSVELHEETNDQEGMKINESLIH